MTPSSLGFQIDASRNAEPDTAEIAQIARLGTARSAFVGRTLRGPVNRPIFLTNFAQFHDIFGGLWQPSTLGYAVEQFFDNGGREALIVRVVNGARSATLTLRAGGDGGGGGLRLRALRPGTREFLRASVDYDNLANDNSTDFNLTVQRVRAANTAQVEDQEIFLRMSMLPESSRSVAALLAESELVQLDGELPAERPERTLDVASGLATRYVSSSGDGDDGAPLTDYDVIGSRLEATGLFALETGEPFNLLCIPPLSRDQDVGLTTLLVAARYCKDRRALLIVDPPSSWQTAEEALRGKREWDFSSENAFMYFPHVLVLDKLRGKFESFAPCGAVAGMLARLDEAAPVWGAAKPDGAVLRPGCRPGCLVGEDKRMRLAAQSVNTLQAVRSAARIGVQPRTLAAGSAGASDWQHLAARRLALFILNCVERGTRWVIRSEFAASIAARTGLVALRAETQVINFFEGLHEAGAFGERSPAESYFAICDSRVNTAQTAAANEFHLVIGFAAERRGEFHGFRIAHSPAGSRITAVSLNRLNSAQYSPQELEWVDSLATQLT